MCGWDSLPNLKGIDGEQRLLDGSIWVEGKQTLNQDEKTKKNTNILHDTLMNEQ